MSGSIIDSYESKKKKKGFFSKAGGTIKKIGSSTVKGTKSAYTGYQKYKADAPVRMKLELKRLKTVSEIERQKSAIAKARNERTKHYSNPFSIMEGGSAQKTSSNKSKKKKKGGRSMTINY